MIKALLIVLATGAFAVADLAVQTTPSLLEAYAGLQPKVPMPVEGIRVPSRRP